jgi:hypothetical protein
MNHDTTWIVMTNFVTVGVSLLNDSKTVCIGLVSGGSDGPIDDGASPPFPFLLDDPDPMSDNDDTTIVVFACRCNSRCA